jgi:hypothetical protein
LCIAFYTSRRYPKYGTKEKGNNMLTRKEFGAMLGELKYGAKVKKECIRVFGARKRIQHGTALNILTNVLSRLRPDKSKNESRSGPFGPSGLRVSLRRRKTNALT